MGKLILGIISVLVLQIAFLKYLSERPSTDATLIATAARPVILAPDISKPNEGPASAVESPKSIATEKKPVKLRSPAPMNRSRGGTNPESLPNTAKPERPIRVPAPARVSTRSHRSPENTYAHTASDRLIPSGYTMVLIDEVKAPPMIKTKEVRKTKKRSYLERTIPALVKKPWKWVKSLASKLN